MRMKKLLFLPLILLFFITARAQEEPYHPYQKFGDTKIEVLTLSNGKYNEFFDTDTIEIIGSAVLNTKTMKVIGFVEKDTTYSEATLYPTVVSRWLSPDPLAAKYPSMSPYNFVYNSPIITIDTDGREGIVVSGSPGDHKNKSHFLINGLYKAQAAQKHLQRKGEKVTWLIYNDPTEGAGHDSKQLAEYKAKAEKLGINVMIVTKSKEIVNYVNKKNGNDSREVDPITSFYYVGHATPGDLDVGYGGTGENFEPDDFNSKAFSSGCHVNLVGGCRTAKHDIFEDSAVTQFQEILDENSDVSGSDVRVQYSGGVITDENLVKHNSGNIVTRKGELPAKK